jgi:drug/metabolite transporter (DMT)-like permease
MSAPRPLTPGSQQKWQAGLLFAVLTAAQWGIGPPLLKELLPVLGSATIVWCRLTISALVLAAYFATYRSTPWRAALERRNLILIAIATIGLLGNYIVFMFGLEHIPPGAAQVLGQLGPLSLLVGGVVIFREPFSPLQWIGIALAIFGLGLFFHEQFSTLLQPGSYGVGVLLVASASLLWGAFGLAQKALGGRVGSQQVLLIIYTIGIVVYLPSAQLDRIPAMTTRSVVYLLLASLSVVVSYVTLSAAMRRWDASRVSAILTTTPLFTLSYVTLATWWLPGYATADALDWLNWIGAALVVLGSCVAAIARR